MATRKMVLAASLVVILGLASMASSIGATGNMKNTTYLTFSGSFQIPGKVLGAGTYVFETPEPQDAWTVVRVSSRDRKTVYLTAFTRTVQRPNSLRHDQAVTFGEASKGTPPPLQAWYPRDASIGHEFIY